MKFMGYDIHINSVYVGDCEMSIEVTNIDNQNYDLNIYRNLNWQDAEKLKNSLWRKLWFKLKYKLGA